MRAEDLVFWLDVLVEGDQSERGVLCRRHADSMVVPRGWTLNDLRDPHLRLFRPPPRPHEPKRTPRRRGGPVDRIESGQLPLDPNLGATGLAEQRDPPGDNRPDDGQLSDQELVMAPHVADRRDVVADPQASRPVGEVVGEAVVDVVGETPDVSVAARADEGSKWTPEFDDGDDLDGLLAARSPLLSRAFRINDRPS